MYREFPLRIAEYRQCRDLLFGGGNGASLLSLVKFPPKIVVAIPGYGKYLISR